MDDKLIAYLLGELPEEEEIHLEELYLWDKEKREQLQLVKRELMQAYARNELTGSRRAAFETRFLDSPKSQRQLRFALAWNEYAAQAPPAAPPPPVAPADQSPPWWQGTTGFFRSLTFPQLAVAAAAIVLMLVVSGLLYREMLQLRSEVDRLRAENRQLKEQPAIAPGDEQERQRAAELAQQLKAEREQRAELERELAKRRSGAGLVVASFTLSSIFVRDSAKELVIPPGSASVEVKLLLEGGDEYRDFDAQLLLEGTREIFFQGMLKLRRNGAGRYIVMKIPADAIVTNDYIIKVSGIDNQGKKEEVALFPFRAVKR